MTPLTVSSAASIRPSPWFTASGSISLTRPSRAVPPMRNDCITPCFVNLQYPVVASGCCGGGAMSWSHSRTAISSVRRGDAFMMAWASVEVGVYGFSERRSWTVGIGAASVLRALSVELVLGQTSLSRLTALQPGGAPKYRALNGVG